MRIDTKTALLVFIRTGKIRTRRLYEHNEVRHVRISEYLRFLLKK